MDGKLHLEIVTPKGRALVATADEVTAPSVKGEFGVLPGHLPLLAALQTGIVTYRVGSDTKKCAVARGFVEAGSDKVMLLTDDYVDKDAVEPVEVRKDLMECEQRLDALQAKVDGGVEEQGEVRVLAEKILWLATQLELYGEPPIATLRLVDEAKEVLAKDEPIVAAEETKEADA